MNAGAAHEPMGINVGRVGRLAAITVASFLLALGASLLIWILWLRPTSRVAAQASAQVVSAPSRPRQAPIELDALRAEQRRMLHGYGWVDRRAGIARIPIARAMTLLAAGAAAESGERTDLESRDPENVAAEPPP